jgi:hypothetical protein
MPVMISHPIVAIRIDPFQNDFPLAGRMPIPKNIQGALPAFLIV